MSDLRGGGPSTRTAVRDAAKTVPGWVGIVANANSGQGAGRKKVERLISALAEQGVDTEVAWTLAERSALVERTRTDPSCRCLVAVGGDGTVGDLVNERPRVPLTVLPAGTENLFARYFRMGGRPEALAGIISTGRVIPLDLGVAGGRRYALMAGIGFDAEVVSRHHAARIRHTGSPRPTHRGAYVAPVLQASWAYRFPALSLSIQDEGREETLTGTTAFVFNLPSYALGLPFVPTASAQDGLLDVLVFRDPGPFRALSYLGMVLLGRHLNADGVYHRRVRRVVVSSTEPVPVQLDGDPAGMITPDHPWTIEVLPRAISVLLPAVSTPA